MFNDVLSTTNYGYYPLSDFSLEAEKTWPGFTEIDLNVCITDTAIIFFDCAFWCQ